jgi:hypothetical protein
MASQNIELMVLDLLCEYIDKKIMSRLFQSRNYMTFYMSFSNNYID